VLEVEDNGPGADDKTMGQGVGRTLMTAFARQLRGRAEILEGSAGGVLARLTFPTPEVGAESAGREVPPAHGGKQAAA
jgi:two-component sensor histidine kinase